MLLITKPIIRPDTKPLSARELGISKPLHSALLQVLSKLEGGELVHDISRAKNRPNGFNMGGLRLQTKCGTVACICGWAEIIAGVPYRTFYDEWENNEALAELFMPIGGGLSKILPSQAARALRSWFFTGDARWDEALA